MFVLEEASFSPATRHFLCFLQCPWPWWSSWVLSDSPRKMQLRFFLSLDLWGHSTSWLNCMESLLCARQHVIWGMEIEVRPSCTCVDKQPSIRNHWETPRNLLRLVSQTGRNWEFDDDWAVELDMTLCVSYVWFWRERRQEGFVCERHSLQTCTETRK